MLDEENRGTDKRSLILLAIESTYNTKKFLELCLVIYNMEGKNKESKEIEKLLKDQTFMREVSMVSTIKETPEERLYYLDEDVTTGSLQYKEQLETRITDITIKNLQTLSKILKTLNEEENIEL